MIELSSSFLSMLGEVKFFLRKECEETVSLMAKLETIKLFKRKKK